MICVVSNHLWVGQLIFKKDVLTLPHEYLVMVSASEISDVRWNMRGVLRPPRSPRIAVAFLDWNLGMTWGLKWFSGWWFGTWILVPLYWEVHRPNWLSYVSEELKPPISFYMFIFSCSMWESPKIKSLSHYSTSQKKTHARSKPWWM